MIEERLAQGLQVPADLQNLTKELADKSKNVLKGMPNKDNRYKYCVQVIVGQNNGQGIRMGSRQFWDEENDNLCFVTVVKKDFFITVAAFACYLY